MRPSFTTYPKLSGGDRVAVVSPSFAAPALFPAVHERGLRRLAEEFGVVPVEFPTTRRLHASPQDRAAATASDAAAAMGRAGTGR